MELGKGHMYKVKRKPVVWGAGTQDKQPKWMASIPFNIRNGRELKLERIHEILLNLKNRMEYLKNK